jgi:hypothetical protein
VAASQEGLSSMELKAAEYKTVLYGCETCGCQGRGVVRGIIGHGVEDVTEAR